VLKKCGNSAQEKVNYVKKKGIMHEYKHFTECSAQLCGCQTCIVLINVIKAEVKGKGATCVVQLQCTHLHINDGIAGQWNVDISLVLGIWT